METNDTENRNERAERPAPAKPATEHCRDGCVFDWSQVDESGETYQSCRRCGRLGAEWAADLVRQAMTPPRARS